MGFDRIGPYRVLERIGRGGMGEIFTTEDERLHRVVALKTISPELVPDAASRQPQLLSTSDGRPIWGTKIDATLDDVFRLQDEVSREIIRALEVQLTAADERRLGLAPRGRADAQEHYLRGRVHLLSEGLPALRAAIDEFEQSIRLDPAFARGYAGLAAAYNRMAFSFEPDAGYYQRAEEMTERALAIDPELAEAHYLRAHLAWTPDAGFQHEVAIRALGRTSRRIRA